MVTTRKLYPKLKISVNDLIGGKIVVPLPWGTVIFKPIGMSANYRRKGYSLVSLLFQLIKTFQYFVTTQS